MSNETEHWNGHCGTGYTDNADNAAMIEDYMQRGEPGMTAEEWDGMVTQPAEAEALWRTQGRTADTNHVVLSDEERQVYQHEEDANAAWEAAASRYHDEKDHGLAEKAADELVDVDD